MSPLLDATSPLGACGGATQLNCRAPARCWPLRITQRHTSRTAAITTTTATIPFLFMTVAPTHESPGRHPGSGPPRWGNGRVGRDAGIRTRDLLHPKQAR